MSRSERKATLIVGAKIALFRESPWRRFVVDTHLLRFGASLLINI